MRAIVQFVVSAVLIGSTLAWAQPVAKDTKKDAKKDTKKDATSNPPPGAKTTPASELTRTKLLKVKVNLEANEMRLGDLLKEIAAQVDMDADMPVMWMYGKDFPYSQKVTYRCSKKPVDVVLNELFKKLGTLGYVIIAKEGDRRDGWILVTTTGERGYDKGGDTSPKTDVAEADAVAKLALAKKLIDLGKNEQAKTVLSFIIKRYPEAKVTPEAKALLEKLEK